MKNLLNYFVKEYTQTYERVCPDNPDEIFENHLKVYEFASQFVKGKSVLDVGCGCGYGTHFLLESGAGACYGIDYSKEAIRYCKKHYHTKNVTFSKMNAEKLKFKDSFFDVVFSSENLEHLHNPQQNISEIHRVLKSDGMLVLGTPNREMFSPGFEPENEYHIKEFYYTELYELLFPLFKKVFIFENQLESTFPEGRELKTKRQEKGELGILTENKEDIVLNDLTINLEHLHNTHSFLCLCWK